MIRPRPLHTSRSLAATHVLSLAFGLTPAATAQPAPPRELTARAASAFESGRYADALRDLDQARGLVDPAQPELAAQLDFNRSCALLRLEKPAEAEKILRDLDTRRGLDRTLRAEVRYNLGLLEAQHAETLAKSDPPKAIEALRSAERRFRNALADSPGDADAARNIDIVQRRRAELMKQQEQQQQKKEQQDKSDKQDQHKQHQQQQDQHKQDQKSEHDKGQSGDKQQDNQRQDSAASPQNQDQSPEQKKASPQQQDKQQKAGPDRQNKPTDGKQDEMQQPDDQARQEQPKQQPRQRQDEGDPKDSAKPADKPNPAQADPSATEQREPRNPREFDVAAAQILDKERLRREQIRRMLQQMMRSRAVKADKDW
ncbi:MAG: hypothetical protein IT438_16640 [Phycisphaerales bacterium]|nr:hypothetical protein [Phycisphaerales bacterium]